MNLTSAVRRFVATALAVVVLAAPTAHAEGYLFVRLPDGTYVVIGARGHDGRGSGSVSAAGLTCGFYSTDDGGNGVLQPNEQFGLIFGGPYVVADLITPADNVGPDDGGGVTDMTNGEITCSINVGSDSYTAAHAASANAEGFLQGLDESLPVEPGFVVDLAPTPLSFSAPPGSNVYMCTEWILEDGASETETHLYYDYTTDWSDPTGQTALGFTTDGTAAKCGLAISTG